MIRQITNSFITKEKCMELFSNITVPAEAGNYCHATHDGSSCWPPTLAGTQVKQPCPTLPDLELNPSQFVYRRCGLDGEWSDITDAHIVFQKTLYEECFIKGPTLESLNQNAKISNILGIVLLLVSLITIFVALLIYYVVLPKFVNGILHVRVQKHLFVSVIFDATTKLTIQMLLLFQLQKIATVEITFAHEFLATLKQYSDLAMILWLTNDSHFLQVISRSGQICNSGYMTYIVIGWGLPIVPTSVWAVSMAVSHKVKDWTGHTESPLIWIMEIPKLLALLTAFSFLGVTTYRVFARTKHTKHKSHLDVRKIKYDILMSGIFYLVILVSVLFIMIITHARIKCISCSYISTILSSSHGILLSILYCFLNNNVHAYIKYSQTVIPTAA
ncbi:PDF receptor-like [Ylistrum balloti]|uniref:PDF receptor-like n=1 Tax=Ylistrum balloti TaxID=509963 RepID=UPI002905C7AE|nr:PDF receptor-like [Ylistrum balloti]